MKQEIKIGIRLQYHLATINALQTEKWQAS